MAGLKFSRIFLVVAFATLMLNATIPIVHSQATTIVGTYQPYIYIVAIPNPVQVNRPIYLCGFFDCPPPYPVSWGGEPFKNIKIEITRPDGQKETLTIQKTDEVGLFGISYTPNQVGTYKVKAIFPGQVMPIPDTRPPGSWIRTVGNWNFLPCESKEYVLTVTEQPTPVIEDTPLPQGYWRRPIYAIHRLWYSISGNWLSIPPNNFASSTKAPETAHIVWTKPLAFGGLVGGEQYTSHSYHMGQAYEGKWVNPIVISGRLYYMEYGHGHSQYYPDIVCVDIRSGEEIWRINATGRGDPVKVQLSGGGAAYGYWEGYPQLSFGQIYYYDSPNQHGAFAYFWCTGGLGATARWDMYDAWTGDWIMSLKGVPSGTRTYGPNGEILIYVVNLVRGWIALWNSSAAIPRAGPIGTDAWQYRLWPGATIDVSKPYNWTVTSPTGVKYSWTVNPYSWNITIPANLPGSVWAVDNDNMIVGSNLGTTYYSYNPWSVWAISLNPKTRGQLLWLKNYPAPPNNITMQRIAVSFKDKVFVVREKETLKYYGYSLDGGERIWGPLDFSKFVFDMYEPQTAIAYGKLFLCAYGGALYCIDIKSGQLLWTYEATDPTGEAMYGENFPLKIGTVADRKIYVVTSEHSPTNPLHRGARLRCIDVDTGNEIWSIRHWSSVQHSTYVVIADGYLIDCDAYDLQIYCYGKGQTLTEVSVSPKTVTEGSSVLIEGKVVDLSPAVKGTPCVADEDMSSWMEYLVKQFPMPNSVKGVRVQLYAFAEDGSSTFIGEVTTDPLNGGIFKLLWTPPKEGTYIITAVFPGSKSYWDSYASTAIGVTSAPPEAPTFATAEQVAENIEPIKSTINVIQLIIIALALMVMVCLCLVAYDIYINRKMLKQAAK